MKFFNDILNNPRKAEKEFNKNVSDKAIKKAYKVGKSVADADNKSKIKPSL